MTRAFEMRFGRKEFIAFSTIIIATTAIDTQSFSGDRSKWNLSTRGEEFSRQCKKTMERRRLQKPNVSNDVGCDCVARRLSGMSNVQLSGAHEIMKIAMTAMLTQMPQAKFYGQLEVLRGSQKTSPKAFWETFDAVRRAMHFCGNPNNNPT